VREFGHELLLWQLGDRDGCGLLGDACGGVRSSTPLRVVATQAEFGRRGVFLPVWGRLCALNSVFEQGIKWP
jgi:hypothetical protein